MDFFNKIIRCDYDEQQNGSGKGRVRRSFILGALLFLLNFIFILVICVNNNTGNKEDVVIMLPGDNVAAQEVQGEDSSTQDFQALTEQDKAAALSSEDGKDTATGKNEQSSTAKKNEQTQTDADIQKVYLTFDDGPSKNTEEILDILKKYNVKATFFVIGKSDKYSKSVYRRIVNEGHTLGMHSYSHDYRRLYKSTKSFEKDLDKIQNLLYDVTGVKSLYYRFPGGSSNTVSNVPMRKLIRVLKKRGINYYDWNALSGDADGKTYTKKQLVRNAMKDVEQHNTSIVLLHDAAAKTKTVEMLPALLKQLKKDGISVLPIDGDTKLVQHVKLNS